jgi:hypothetical protein
MCAFTGKDMARGQKQLTEQSDGMNQSAGM